MLHPKSLHPLFSHQKGRSCLPEFAVPAVYFKAEYSPVLLGHHVLNMSLYSLELLHGGQTSNVI